MKFPMENGITDPGFWLYKFRSYWQDRRITIGSPTQRKFWYFEMRQCFRRYRIAIGKPYRKR